MNIHFEKLIFSCLIWKKKEFLLENKFKELNGSAVLLCVYSNSKTNGVAKATKRFNFYKLI